MIPLPRVYPLLGNRFLTYGICLNQGGEWMLSSSFRRRALIGLTGAVAVATMIGFAAPSAMAAPHQSGPHVLRTRTTTHTAAPQAVIPGAMTNHGGPVQTAPRVFVDFWGWTSDPSGEQAYLNRFLGSVGGTSWLATVNQYGSAAPANLLAGTWSDPAAVPASPSDAQIQAEALSAASHFGTGNSLNVQIVVATPTGHSTPGFGTQFCAYHGVVAADPNVTYTDLPYMTDAGGSCGEGSVNGGNGLLDGVSIVEGHELAETITDPLLNAWFDASGNEIGDKCAWTNLANIGTSAGTFAVQPLWSNAINGCALSTSTNLNVVGTVGATIYHEQRHADGSWTTLNFQSNAPGAITASSSAIDGAGNLQVVVAIGTSIYHEIRFADGSWTTLNFQTNAPAAVNTISAAFDRANNLLDVVVTTGASIYHEQRLASGAWTTLTLQTTAPGTITASSSAADSLGNLQAVFAVGTSIYHEIRFNNGSWTTLNFQTNAPAAINTISGAFDRANNLLDVVVTTGASIYHEQRFAGGAWTTLNFQTTAPGAVHASGSATDDAGNLQVVTAIGTSIYHEIRFNDGSWSTLNFQTNAPGAINAISGAIG